MGDTATQYVGAAQEREWLRRRVRVEQGRSPAQRTSRSINKARAFKRPGKGQRNAWRAEGSL